MEMPYNLKCPDQVIICILKILIKFHILQVIHLKFITQFAPIYNVVYFLLHFMQVQSLYIDNSSCNINIFEIMQNLQHSKSTIQIRDQNYLLKISTDQQHQAIAFQLWVLDKQSKYYAAEFIDDSLPNEIKKLQIDIPLLFECCNANCQVDIRNGIISPLIDFQFKNKRVSKRVHIELHEQESNPLTTIKMLMCQLGDQIEGIKNTEAGQLLNGFEQISKVKIQAKEESFNIDDRIRKLNRSLKQKENILKMYRMQEQIMEKKIRKCLQNCRFLQQEINDKLEYLNKITQNQEISERNPSPRKAIEQQKFKKKKDVEIPCKPKNTKSVKEQLLSILKRSNNNEFKINKYTITLKLEQQKGAQIVINYPMRHNFPKNRFMVKIRQVSSQIKIGVIDRGNSHTLYTKVGIVYKSSTAQVFDWDLIKKQGNGYTKNDVLEVVILNGKIQWFVNGTLEAFHYSKKISTPYITFLPIIQLKQKGDSIEWIPL